MDLTAALHGFTDKPLLGATRDLFKKTLGIPLSPLADSPITAERFFGKNYNDKRHSDVNAVYLGGRITDDSFGLFENDAADIEVLEAELKDKEDYPGLFIFAVDLGDKQLNRTELSTLTRDVNRLFPTPVIVVFKHTLSSKLVLSFGVADRRQHKKDKSKHVLGKVSMIRDIDPLNPHRGHQGLLARFAFKGLKTAEGKPVTNFRSFHSAIAEIFNVELLNKQFYRELSNWYFWAMQNCHFPYLDPDTDKYDLFKDEEKVREHDAKNLIRLLTRILFVWFIKEKGLVPDSFFEPASLKKDLLKKFDPESKETHYYKAILQNLFFATLNQTHGKREFRNQGQHHNTTTLLRYEERLKNPEQFIQIVEDVTPFLNGGLFDCLDYPHPTKKGPQGGAVTVYEDGFSDRKDNPLNVPDFLFFGAPEEVDLSHDYGDKKRKTEKVRGLIHILDGYKFTIVENTPIEQEIALDPELLGQVFENLLASYNPETKTTARKQTGSFYTPRPIVDYMVDESLKAYLLKPLAEEAGMDEDEAKEKLENLFAYNDEPCPFNEEQTEQLIRAIDNCKILDPACGSGAFPMGVLQKLVYVLGKLDPRDELWEKRQLAKVNNLIEAAQDFDDASFRERAIADADAQRKDIEEAFANNELGYGRKLYLIENCLYGVDIQSIATQVSKLRFFISLIVEQTVDKARENFGIRPLPNLETKFVTADTLIQIEKPKAQGELFELAEVSELQKQLKRVRHDLFSAKTPTTKRKHRKRDEELRAAIAQELKQNGWSYSAADKLAAWDPYDQNASATYFDPEWMFGLNGFDIVIGNPPYVTYKGKERVKVSDAYIQSLLKDYPDSADYKINSYALFTDRGLSLLNNNGGLSYIIPSTILQNEKLEKARRLILGQHYLKSLLILESKVFAAITDSIVLFAINSPKCACETSVITTKDLDLSNLEGKTEKYDQDTWLNAEAAVINTRILPHEAGIIRSIEDNSALLGSILKVYVGIVASGMKKFLSDEAHTKNHRKYLQGRDLSKYNKRPRKLYINFEKDKLHSNTDESVYLQKEKILVRKTGNYLLACLDSSQFFTDQSIYNLYNLSQKTYSLETILCYLNSSVLNYYFRKKMITNPDVFPYIKGIHLKQLPLKHPSQIAVALFEKLVPLIQLAKAEGEKEAYTFLEALIDACVIECYFREHMAESDLLFQDAVATQLKDYDPDADEASQATYLKALHTRLQATDLPQKLQAIPEKSPNLLGVILKEGKV